MLRSKCYLYLFIITIIILYIYFYSINGWWPVLTIRLFNIYRIIVVLCDGRFFCFKISLISCDPIFRCAQIPVSCPDVPLPSHTCRYRLTSAFRLHRSFLYRLPEFVCVAAEPWRPEPRQLTELVNARQFVRWKP